MAPASAEGESWSYDYVPGAGDDEESWACGLSPQLMWLHRDALVAAGPAGVHALLADLLQGPALLPSAAGQQNPALSEPMQGDSFSCTVEGILSGLSENRPDSASFAPSIVNTCRFVGW